MEELSDTATESQHERVEADTEIEEELLSIVIQSLPTVFALSPIILGSIATYTTGQLEFFLGGSILTASGLIIFYDGLETLATKIFNNSSKDKLEQ